MKLTLTGTKEGHYNTSVTVTTLNAINQPTETYHLIITLTALSHRILLDKINFVVLIIKMALDTQIQHSG